MTDAREDCIIVGGGPAGLTAAIYLGRYHLSVRLFDAGHSRAAWIPTSHNHAGYPNGVNGRELLQLMREQAGRYGVLREEREVTGLRRDGDGFLVATRDHTYPARTVLLATGVVNRQPAMDKAVHDRAMAAGLLRYCPICDGYEVTDKRVGVLGTSEHGAREALFLRSYTRDLTLISPTAEHDLPPALAAKLDEAGIARVDGPCGGYAIEDGQFAVDTAHGRLRFDSVYPALGTDVNSELAAQIDTKLAGPGCILVDDHQRTSIVGLYAAGDVTQGLDQISHAMGEAGVAATAIRNDLAQHKQLWR